MMIHATAAGNIGKNAEVRRTQSGDPVASFSLATESRVKGEKVTTWVDVSIWGQRGEKLAQYLTKGSKVTVVGRMSTREYEGKTYLQIDASEVALQGGKQDGGSQDDGYGAGGRPQGGGYGAPSDMDDEIPFFCEWRV